MKKVVVYGAGGHGREVAWLITSGMRNADIELLGYVEDGACPGRRIRDLPVLSWHDLVAEHRDALVAVAVGNPADRQQMVEKCRAAGLHFATLVHPSIDVSGVRGIGEGSIVCSGAILTVDTELGSHVHINVGCTVSHDVVIGDYATLSPGVHIAGNVEIGRGVFFGVGACVINGSREEPLRIGDGALIAAGACVTKSTEANGLYAGVPAQLKKVYSSK